MKPILIFLIVLAFSMQLSASPHARLHSHRPYSYQSHHQPVHPKMARSIRQLPWQSVLAGGTAISGIVFAYKVADGIQTGTVEAARLSPATFLKNGRDTIGSLKVTVILAVVFITGFIGWRLARHRRTSE